MTSTSTKNPDVAGKLATAGVPESDALASLIEPAIQITTMRTAEQLPIGASRFGGSPDVPADFAWPQREKRPLTFLAQIELSALGDTALGTSGWLLFFYDVQEQPWGFDPKDGDAWRVFHLDGTAVLERRPHPKVAEHAGPFPTCRVTFRHTRNLPDAWDRVVTDREIYFESEQREAYDRVASEVAGVDLDGVPFHHLLGYPQLVQDDMRGECQLASNGIYCGRPEDYQSARAKELLKTATADWRLLLQLDTEDTADTGPGWMWGDVGRIYFWIRTDDLRARRFDRVWLVLQCS